MSLRPVEIDPAATIEVEDAARAYEATRPGLAEAFLDDLAALRVKIEAFPESCQEIDPGVRRALFRRFPFGAIYQVRPDRLVIVAVLPTRADPDRWGQRMRDGSIRAAE